MNNLEGPTKKSKVTLSGLLNSLDGAQAPGGYIIILTTDKPEDLVDALIRTGRITLKVAFKRLRI
jgi:mitochondrial chaperone BCS1